MIFKVRRSSQWCWQESNGNTRRLQFVLSTNIKQHRGGRLKFEKRTREAMAEVMRLLDWECDCYEWDTDEYQTLQEMIATIEDILRSSSEVKEWN